MIKNFVFDIGRVIIDWSPVTVMSPYVKDGNRKDLDTLIDAVLLSKTWQDLDRGTLDIKEAKTVLEKVLPKRLVLPMKSFLDTYYLNVSKNSEISALIKSLKERGYDLYLLSNFNEGIYPLMNRFNDTFSLFDGGVFSFKEKTVKPEKEIYEILFNRYSLDPEECFFIDDREENVLTGEDLGMRGFIYKGDITELKDSIETILNSK